MPSKIITATPDYNTHFMNHFETWLDSASPVLYRTEEPRIYWERVTNAKLVIFTGGEDINPAIYGHDVTHTYGINYTRDYVELKILEYCLKMHKKVLGICRGHQLINAFLGGVLVQDLLQELNAYHRNIHKLIPENGGSEIVNMFEHVNSLHHQGVIKVGDGLLPTASFNGVFEVCEAPTIITTQFHPEFMYTRESDDFFDYVKKWAKSEAQPNA